MVIIVLMQKLNIIMFGYEIYITGGIVWSIRAITIYGIIMKKMLVFFNIAFLTTVIYAVDQASTYNQNASGAVQQINVKTTGESPATQLGFAFQSLAHAQGILFANAIAQQQQQSLIANATTTQGLAQLYSQKRANAPIAPNSCVVYTDNLSPCEKEQLRMILIQQIESLDMNDYALSIIMLNNMMLQSQGKSNSFCDKRTLEIIGKVNKDLKNNAENSNVAPLADGFSVPLDVMPAGSNQDVQRTINILNAAAAQREAINKAFEAQKQAMIQAIEAQRQAALQQLQKSRGY